MLGLGYDPPILGRADPTRIPEKSRLLRILPVGLVVCLGLVAPPSAAHARCTTAEDARQVFGSLQATMGCHFRKLLSGPSYACNVEPPPACAGTLVSDAAALVYGLEPPIAAVDRKFLRRQLRCQRLIGEASARFVGLKLRQLIRGHSRARAEARARTLLDALPDRCRVEVAESNGVALPSVGPQLAAAVGAVGEVGRAVDPRVLRDGLVKLLGVWVDRVGPDPRALRPNIVLIVTDDQRADSITPQLMPKLNAELVDDGVLFPLGFASNPLCCPSRASILSGQYAHNHGVLQNGRGDPLDPIGGVSAFSDVSTVATWLRDLAGYRTGLFGKYLNGYSWFSDEYAASHGGVHYVPPGWDRWYGVHDGVGQYGISFIDESGVEIDSDPGTCVAPTLAESCPAQPPGCPHSTDHLRDKALEFIDESVAMGKRFFLYLSTQSPHAPACPAMRHRGTWAGLAPHRPPNYDEGAVGRDDDADKPGWLRQQGPIDAAGIDDLRIRQLESLRSVDDAVGAIMQKLSETGQDANTIVVYYGDNGFQWGEHRRSGKSCPYDECLAVPFVVRYPMLAPLPRAERAPVMNIDLAPTFAALAGLDPATLRPPVDGRNMERLLDGTERAWRTDMLGEHWGRTPEPENPSPPIPTFALVRGQRWKYIEYCTGETELYDLAADPYELTNLASQEPVVAMGLAARLRELNEDWPATIPFTCGVLRGERLPETSLR